MKDFHGIIFAYNTFPELRELVKSRTAASLPFCGRYRLIDFPLSSMRNAGILDVGVIVQRRAHRHADEHHEGHLDVAASARSSSSSLRSA